MQPLRRSLNVPKEGAVEEGKSYTYKLSLTTAATGLVSIQLQCARRLYTIALVLGVKDQTEQVVTVQAPNNYVDEGSNAVSYTCNISHVMSSTDASTMGKCT